VGVEAENEAMSVRTKLHGGTYTRIERVVIDDDGVPQVKSTTCCCGAPGALRRVCARVSNNKTPCRCNCHPRGRAHSIAKPQKVTE
jgi:hypothetical protein